MTDKKYPNIKEKATEWQTCSQDEIDLFEDVFEEGAKDMMMMGISIRLKEAYKDYYRWRITVEEDQNQLDGILKNDSQDI